MDNVNITGCYFEANNYGFKQKRIYGENTIVPIADATRGLELKTVLNPSKFDGKYGGATKYLAIDCEMDQVRAEYSATGMGQNITCKVSVVNEIGQVVLDTLVKPHVQGIDFDDVAKDLMGYKSLQSIHGIKTEWLSDAPSFESVRDHILEICGCKRSEALPLKTLKENKSPNQIPSAPKSETDTEHKYIFVSPQNFDPKLHSIFIGHGVTLDLKVMGIGGVPFLCTQNIDRDPRGSKKLKTLSEQYLNAKIQEGHHSSIIDARASLALFILLKGSMGLELSGPQFLGVFGGDMDFTSRRKRNKKGSATFSQLVNRAAFKSLDNIDAQDPKDLTIGKLSSQTKVSEFNKVELQIQEILGKNKIEKDRIYKVNKNDLIAQIDALVKNEFVKVFRNIAYHK